MEVIDIISNHVDKTQNLIVVEFRVLGDDDDVIREENSFIMSLSNLDTLASNICDAVDNSSKLAEVRENQRNTFMSNYQSSAMLKKYSDLYKNLTR